MLINFHQHCTPPERFKGDPGIATVDLDRSIAARSTADKVRA
jgi:hypothetical protein